MSLTHEDNRRICEVEPGSVMGEMLREHYWFPAYLARELKPGGDPEPLRLLGRDLVIYRGTSGQVGIINEACPHRGASMLLARSEGDSLRCIFHGWRFSVDGECVEVPTQLDNHDAFCKRVPLKSYPVKEAGDLIWVWLGDGEPKKFPNFIFTELSGSHVRASFQLLKFNWIQSVEGLVDTAHISWLHKDWLGAVSDGSTSLSSATTDSAPRLEIEDQPGGFHYASIRRVSDTEKYIRITSFVSPWYCFIPFGPGQLNISVPIDNHTTGLFTIQFDKDGDLQPSEYGPTSTPMSYPPYLSAGREKRWGQDRDAMRRGAFSGFSTHLSLEDFAVAESQGSLADRSKEFLNKSDHAVVHMRNTLLKSLEEFENGETPRIADHSNIPYESLGAHAKVIPLEEDWHNIIP